MPQQPRSRPRAPERSTATLTIPAASALALRTPTPSSTSPTSTISRTRRSRIGPSGTPSRPSGTFLPSLTGRFDRVRDHRDCTRSHHHRAAHHGCAGNPNADSAAPSAPPTREHRPGPAGVPRRSGYVHFRPTSRRCQASSVPGVTIRPSRRLEGSRRESAAITARSAQCSLGWAT
jgi:hypothetical protein